MLCFQQQDDLTDVENADRISNLSDELSEITSAQLLVNSVTRYQEPLVQQQVRDELIKIHGPMTLYSDWVGEADLAVANSTRNLISLLAGRDYPDERDGLLSGTKTLTATGGLVAEITFTDALTSQHQVTTFLSYARNLQVSPDGNFLVTY